jgi:Ser/Thr protein kinase RdoA (MazF antagonist)
MNDPWQSLSYDAILNTVEKTTGLRLSNLLIERNSYINRVYELSLRDSDENVIVKFYRPNRWTEAMINEEHDFLNRLHQGELPVIIPLSFNEQTLFKFGDIYYAIFPKKGGRALDELDRETWQRIGRLLARLHLIGNDSQINHRVQWTPDIASQKSIDYLLSTNLIPPDMLSAFSSVVSEFMTLAMPKFIKLERFAIHGDCHLGNLIHRLDEGLFIVDFDDMCVGPAVQDLWMLLPGSPQECEREIDWFLEGYEVFRDFNYGSIELLPILRIMRLLHYCSWCAMQSNDSKFATIFPLWGGKQYWNELIRDIQANLRLVLNS